MINYCVINMFLISAQDPPRLIMFGWQKMTAATLTLAKLMEGRPFHYKVLSDKLVVTGKESSFMNSFMPLDSFTSNLVLTEIRLSKSILKISGMKNLNLTLNVLIVLWHLVLNMMGNQLCTMDEMLLALIQTKTPLYQKYVLVCIFAIENWKHMPNSLLFRGLICSQQLIWVNGFGWQAMMH